MVYSVQQVAEMRGVSAEVVRKHIRAGVVRSVKVGRTWFMEHQVLAAYKPVQRGRGRPRGSKDRKLRGA